MKFLRGKSSGNVFHDYVESAIGFGICLTVAVVVSSATGNWGLGFIVGSYISYKFSQN